MTKYFLGIDGGGTKTHACIVDSEGHILGMSAGGAANWERIGLVATKESLREIITSVLNQAGLSVGDISSSTLALAGIDWNCDVEMFAPLTSELGIKDASVLNDSFAALYAGSPTGDGCVSISGTGGKTSGRHGKLSTQTMGMSLGEAGGAGQLVALALDYVARAFHGSEQPTQLTPAVLDASGFSDTHSLFQAVARDGAVLTEDFAPIVFALANSGDLGAISLVKTLAHQHAQDVAAIISQLNFGGKEVQVVRAGGLHTAGCKLFNETFEEMVLDLYPAAKIHVLNISPVFGAIIHSAQQELGELSSQFLETLFTEAREQMTL
jgi:N-acetylglucosamine kinase-like BadF-type ATPase